MTTLLSLLGKIRRKGLAGSVRIFVERYIYHHQELVTLERPIGMPNYRRNDSERRPLITINHELLPAFERYFSHYHAALTDLLEQDVQGYALLNKTGDAIMMMWVADKDYYDHQLYRCWVRLPPGCIYHFAGELAAPYRRGLLLPHFINQVWDIYQQQGMHTARALVSKNNPTAMRTLMHGGAYEVGESIHVYRILGFLHFNRRSYYDQPRQQHVMQNKASRSRLAVGNHKEKVDE